MMVSVSSHGRVVIPVALRRRLDIRQGTRFTVYEDRGRIVLDPIARDDIRKARGMFKGSNALEILMAERRRERGE